MLDKGACLRYYKDKQVANLLYRSQTNGACPKGYGEAFGKHLTCWYESDVLEFAKQNVTSFHVSEEHWRDRTYSQTKDVNRWTNCVAAGT